MCLGYSWTQVASLHHHQLIELSRQMQEHLTPQHASFSEREKNTTLVLCYFSSGMLWLIARSLHHHIHSH